MENIKLNEEIKNKINSLIGFVSSITANLDDDFAIEDGITISEGWDVFVQPVLDMIDNKQNND